jgi:hypothetical protein
VSLLDASKLAMEKPSIALTTCLERTSTVYLSTMILLRILWAQWQKMGSMEPYSPMDRPAKVKPLKCREMVTMA